MNLRRRRPDDVEINNVVPLVDMLFILLIFFAVTSTFQKEAQLRIDLPEASQTPSAVKKDTIEITIDVEGNYFVNNQRLINSSRETLIKALKIVTKGKEKMPLMISADAKTAHQSVVTAMDAAGQLGIVNISISTISSKTP